MKGFVIYKITGTGGTELNGKLVFESEVDLISASALTRDAIVKADEHMNVISVETRIEFEDLWDARMVGGEGGANAAQG